MICNIFKSVVKVILQSKDVFVVNPVDNNNGNKADNYRVCLFDLSIVPKVVRNFCWGALSCQLVYFYRICWRKVLYIGVPMPNHFNNLLAILGEDWEVRAFKTLCKSAAKNQECGDVFVMIFHKFSIDLITYIAFKWIDV